MNFLSLRHPTHSRVCFSSRDIVHKLFSVISRHSAKAKIACSFVNNVIWMSTQLVCNYFESEGFEVSLSRGAGKKAKPISRRIVSADFKNELGIDPLIMTFIPQPHLVGKSTRLLLWQHINDSSACRLPRCTQPWPHSEFRNKIDQF